jgi:hypothetical protein
MSVLLFNGFSVLVQGLDQDILVRQKRFGALGFEPYVTVVINP